MRERMFKEEMNVKRILSLVWLQQCLLADAASRLKGNMLQEADAMNVLIRKLTSGTLRTLSAGANILLPNHRWTIEHEYGIFGKSGSRTA